MRAKRYKLRATVSVDIEAGSADELEARRQRFVELVAQVRAEYGNASLETKVPRPRRTARAAPPPPLGAGFEIVRARYVG